MLRWLALLGSLALASCSGRAVALPDLPEVRSRSGVARMTLTARRDADGRNAFEVNGNHQPPTIRVFPGDRLDIHYLNALPHQAPARGQPINMTNPHFHGLAISPERPQDDAIDMIAMPGDALDYTLSIPPSHLPGLGWYHTHPHGESHQQVLDGMSGALVIEGIDRYVPAVRSMAERILVIRALDIEHDRRAPELRRRVDMERSACGDHREAVERVFTVNGALRPRIETSTGGPEFWRIVNAAADRYVDVEVPGESLEVVAYDGFPIAYHDPEHPTRRVGHALLPPGGRVEAVVNAGPPGTRSVLRTRCVDTGPDGDPNPGMVLADISSTSTGATGRAGPGGPADVTGPIAARAPRIRPDVVGGTAAAFAVLDLELESLERQPARFVAVFSEDHNGFYINGQKYAADAPPMVRSKIGGYEHWTIVNDTRELHPMHIHQAHFLAYLENGRPVSDPQWLDTVNVPTGGSVDVIMDFTNPVIRGMSLFHCHLLNHEDKGMMAKVLFE